jgi:hypothetical protein
MGARVCKVMRLSQETFTGFVDLGLFTGGLRGASSCATFAPTLRVTISLESRRAGITLTRDEFIPGLQLESLFEIL